MRTIIFPSVQKIVIGAFGLLIVACASMPQGSVVQGGSESAVFFESFPAEATVTINGNPIGIVGDYNGIEQTLAVPAGTHTVQISNNGKMIYNKKVYVGREGAIKITR